MFLTTTVKVHLRIFNALIIKYNLDLIIKPKIINYGFGFYRLIQINYLIAACAAAILAIGILKGEQLTYSIPVL